MTTAAEQELIDALDALDWKPEPGTRCPTCHRRVNRKRTEESPTTKEMRIRGPVDLTEDNDRNLDILQEYVGADEHAYPKAKLVSVLIALGARHREEVKEHMSADAT